MKNCAVIWFRNDLRLFDNPALHFAHKSGKSLLFLYIHSQKKGDTWEIGSSSRFWLYHSLKELQKEIRKIKGKLIIREGDSATVLSQIFQETDASSIYWNAQYELLCIKRDNKIKIGLEAAGIDVHVYHGNLLFSPYKIVRVSKRPYKVFDLFWEDIKNLSLEKPVPAPSKIKSLSKKIYSLDLNKTQILPKEKKGLGWEKTWEIGSQKAGVKLLKVLEEEQSPSFLSPHLHFGELSPREIGCKIPKTEFGYKLFKRLALREFANHVLLFFPQTPSQSLKEEFKNFPWSKNKRALAHWKEGMTGYPFIDASMRQLQSTGWMDFSSRRIVASFLIKELLVHWKEGAKWFWEHLIDADLANNILAWQSIAGCGTDVSDYIFDKNSIEEGQKQDPTGQLIRKFIPALKDLPDFVIHTPYKASQEVLEKAGVTLGKTYPYPIVLQNEDRKKSLDIFPCMRSV